MAERKKTAKTNSGVQEDGRFLPAFERQREPFGPGNQIGVRHGAYARLQLAPEAAETAEVLADLVPGFAESDEAAVQLLAFVLEQLKVASRALTDATDRGERDQLLRLSHDAREWVRTALRCLKDLALTPAARAALGLTVAQAARTARFDLSGLDDEQLKTLETILAQAEAQEAQE